MKKFLTIILILICLKGLAQDPIFTQFFMLPETLSSSFTGAKQSTRAGIIHRTQWPGLNFSIDTQYAFVDNWFEEVNSGVGISVLNHKETITRYNFTQINLNYAYQFQISEDWNVRPSLSVGYGSKDFGFQNLVLEDQINIFSGIINPNKSASNSHFLTSINAFVGMDWEGFRFGYSYDFNVTDIGRTGGVYELSISYDFLNNDNCFGCPDY